MLSGRPHGPTARLRPAAGLGFALALGWAACAGPEATPRSGTSAAGLHYEVRGSGAPLVLLHGFSLDLRMWDAQVGWLARDHRVVRYDMRGHGRSAEAGAPFSHHEDLAGLLEELGLERAVLVGLSMGAEVAIDFAIAHPERVSGLVLASPGLSGYQPQGSFEWMGAVMTALQAGDARAATRAWVETPLMRIEGDPGADAAMRVIALDNWDVWTGDPSLRRRLDPPAVGRLAEIDAPTLVLVGAADLLDTRAVADTLAARVPGAEKVTVPGAGHLLNLAAPAAFDAALQAFLERR